MFHSEIPFRDLRISTSSYSSNCGTLNNHSPGTQCPVPPAFSCPPSFFINSYQSMRHWCHHPLETRLNQMLIPKHRHFQDVPERSLRGISRTTLPPLPSSYGFCLPLQREKGVPWDLMALHWTADVTCLPRSSIPPLRGRTTPTPTYSSQHREEGNPVRNTLHSHN